MARIVSIGAAVQNVYLVGEKPHDFEKLAFEVNGNGINSAITFARHGHETILISNISNDAAGEAVMRALDDENIDTSYLNINTRKPTGFITTILNPKTYEKSVFTALGTATKFDNFSPDDLDSINPDWLYVSNLFGDTATLENFIKKAKSIKCQVMLNPGPDDFKDTKFFLRLLKNVDILLLNKAEASQLVPGTTLAELISHLKNYAKMTIITDGLMGGIIANSEKTYRFGTYEEVKRRDLTGAGDAFGAGFLAHFVNQNSIRASLTFASANAASVIQKLGSTRGILTGKEELHPMPIQKL